MTQLKIYVTSPELTPQRAHPSDSGLDLYAKLPYEFDVISPHCRRLIKTGVHAAVPEGFEIQVRSRSGLAINKGVFVLNSPGTIDCSYRGEIGVILYNTTDDDVKIHHMDRIAQMVMCPIVLVNPVIVDSVEDLGETVRGAGGYGSTGA